MSKGLIAKATIDIQAPVIQVWNALITPEIIRQYMFGTEVVSQWQEGGPIVWKGIWEGKSYQDKGTILKMEPPKLLQYTHFSPISGNADTPENYHTLTYELTDQGKGTHISLSQDNNANEKEKEHSLHMWQSLLEELKKVLER